MYSTLLWPILIEAKFENMLLVEMDSVRMLDKIKAVLKNSVAYFNFQTGGWTQGYWSLDGFIVWDQI